MLLRAVPVGTQPQLFVDDYLIAESEGVEEHLHAMTKHPTPVLTAETPWERPGQGTVANPVAVYDVEEQLHKLWYSSQVLFSSGGETGAPRYKCYATSRDGIHVHRPELGLVDYDGSTANNILPADAGGGPILDCVEMSHVEPPELRYKSVNWLGFDEDGMGTHGVRFSADGLRWRDYEGNPVIRGREHGDAVSCAKLRDTYADFGPPGFPSAKYAIFLKTHLRLGRWWRRCVGVATSAPIRGGRFPGRGGVPFTEWTQPVLALAPDPRDDDLAEARLAAARPHLLYDHPEDHRAEFYEILVHRYGDLLLGFLWVFEPAFECSRLGGANQHGPVHVQLVSSRDLIHWHRAGDRQPILAPGEPGSFDAAMIFGITFPLPMGAEWGCYYAGTGIFHTAWPYLDAHIRLPFMEDLRAGRRQPPAIGLAKVRREGFVSRDAGAAGGTLTTRPLRPGAGRLTVNANVASGGELRVAVHDASGQALPGFEAEACTPVAGDAIRHAVHWGERGGDASWPHRELRLTFHLRDAELYAFQFTEDADPD